MYIPPIKAIKLIEWPASIKIPKVAAPVAVAKTIIAVVIAFIPPMYLTPYISAHVEDPKIFEKPLEIPISPNNAKEEIGLSKKIKTITLNKSGIFI